MSKNQSVDDVFFLVIAALNRARSRERNPPSDAHRGARTVIDVVGESSSSLAECLTMNLNATWFVVFAFRSSVFMHKVTSSSARLRLGSIHSYLARENVDAVFDGDRRHRALKSEERNTVGKRI
jgi:hypothetical protein